MKRFITGIILLFSLNILHAQSPDSAYTYVEQMPKFNGNLNKYISNCIEIPELKQNETIQTYFVFSFIIEKDGSVSSVRILNPRAPKLDSALAKCFIEMPKWQPGMQNNKPVRVLFKVPINIDVK
jgi:hypothetical protein